MVRQNKTKNRFADLTWDDLNDWAGSKIVSRGRRYQQQGRVSELPIQWNYYVVADEHGRQTALAFTVEGKLVERFNKADEKLIRSFRFLDPKLATSGGKQLKVSGNSHNLKRR